MSIVGTAGHVDAGKSTLIHALTGTHPDRWAEERSRGLTIDLGFAATTLSDGTTISFVDVPGHVRFLRNMLTGAGGIAGVLFVVAANDGWRAQSQEHLDILELLGVTQGLVVITKVQLVEPAQVHRVRAQIVERLAHTALRDSEIVEVDTPTGRGVEAVRTHLASLVARLGPVADHHRPRVWVDRSFTVRGVGTVVTGVVDSGAVRQGEELQIVPGGRSVRVRGLQRHHETIDRAEAGQRVALNLADLGSHDIERGDALVRPGDWHVTQVVDVDLQVLGSLGHSVRRAGAFALHVGSAERSVTLRIIGGAKIEPGATGLARLRLDRAVAVAPGDRFVLREFGRDETVGGGVILDVDPVLSTSRARPDRSVARLVRERGRLGLDQLHRLAEPGYDRRELTVLGDWAVDPLMVTSTRESLLQRLAAAPHGSLSLADLNELERRLVATTPELEVRGDRLVRPGAQLGDAALARLGRLQADGLSPEQPTAAERAVITELARAGQALRCGGLWFATSSIDHAITALAEALASAHEGANAGQLRDSLGTSRRFAIPVLEWCDDTGRTRRRGDRRVAGPRSGSPIDARDLGSLSTQRK